MGDKINVLMTGAGSPGGPGIIQALKKNTKINLHIADANPNASGRYISTDCSFYQLPMAGSKNFIATLLNLCINKKISVILPLVTKELFKLSVHKKKFLEKGIKLIVSDEDALFLANNKCLLYQHLKKKKIDVPKFFIVNNKNQLKEAAIKLDYGKVPVVIKPCIGNGSRGVRILDENADRFDLLFNHKPTSIFSTLSEVINSIGKKKMPQILVSEYLPGTELTIDTIVEEGILLDCLIRTRTTINSGISTSGKFINDKKVTNYINKIVSSIPGLKGPVGFQIKKSVLGKYLLLESNPRIQGTSVAALGLGINLPVRIVDQALGLNLKKVKKISGISFARYYQEAFYDS